jgi:hypothetical protein
MKDDAPKALELKELLIELSPLIEEYTSQTCPACGDVCCKQKRSLPEPEDVRFASALGMPLPDRDPLRPPDGPCQFMGPRGCVTERWLRPWRCTWYFCDPLLRALDEGPRKKARAITALVQRIVDIRAGWP